MAALDASQVTIRPARPEDSPAIRVIRNLAIRESLAIWTSQEASEEEARAWLATPLTRGTALVIEGPDAALLGFAVASPWHNYEGYARTVEDSIYLSPAAQGLGLGSRLLQALMDACCMAGDRTMIAMIESGNTASIRLHEHHGFGIDGTIPAAGEKFGKVLDLTLMSVRL